MWIKVRQYAEHEKISTHAVGYRIKAGKVKCKMEGNQRYVEVPDDYLGEQPQPQSQSDAPIAEESSWNQHNKALETRWSVENALKEMKVKNLEAEIILKRQKSKDYKERLRVEFCEGVLECFTDAFSDLKASLVDCKLRKEQTKKFRETYAKCLKSFEKKLSEYLKQKDKAFEDESKAEEQNHD